MPVIPSGFNAPPPQWQASDYALQAWAFDPDLGVATSTPLATAGVAFLVGLQLRQQTLISNIVTFLVTAGATLTAGQCFAGVYNSAGTQQGVTADQSVNWAGTGVLTMALTAPVTLPAGTYRVAYLFNGTTGPAILRGNSLSAVNLGLTGSGLRNATSGAAQTALPGTLAAPAAASTAFWAGLS